LLCSFAVSFREWYKTFQKKEKNEIVVDEFEYLPNALDDMDVAMHEYGILDLL